MHKQLHINICTKPQKHTICIHYLISALNNEQMHTTVICTAHSNIHRSVMKEYVNKIIHTIISKNTEMRPHFCNSNYHPIPLVKQHAMPMMHHMHSLHNLYLPFINTHIIRSNLNSK